MLRDVDVDQIRPAATDQEQRDLIEELLEWVTVFPDRLEVTVVVSPPLAHAYGEVGPKESQIVGIGGAQAILSTRGSPAHSVGDVGRTGRRPKA